MPKMLLLEKISNEEMIDRMKELYSFALKKLPKIDRKPKIVLEKDKKNAEDFFGKTGFYDPKIDEIHLFITDRHPKDVLRSFAHELVHHEQNCSGYTATVDMSKTHEADYASKDPKLREAERDAFERGNMIFRDWTDSIKAKREDKNMKESQLKEVIKQMIQEITSKGGEKARRAKDPMAYKPPAERKKKSMKYEPNSKEDPTFGKKGQTWGDAVGEPEKKEKVSEVSYDKSNLKHPEKADLNKDKDLSSYELKRGKAIEKSIGGKKDPVKEAEALGRAHAKKALEQKTGKDLKRMKKEASGYEAVEKLEESRQIGGIVELKPVSEIQHPYPHLFDKKERAFKDAFEQKDERIYNELMKRFGFTKDGDK